ncbi:MAG: cobyrinate a,c-diamide synthase [Thermodesulfobacteriota bacterium]
MPTTAPAAPRALPRLLLAGLSGGAGKTILSLGLARALAGDGMRVQPFKKGPDYIDARWLSLAAQRPASNLDPFFLAPDALRALFWDRARDADIALVEGNRGLFDGLDVDGSCSSAELARVLDLPVVLSLDCTKMTRTAAAVVAGVAAFEPGLRLAGVVLGRTAGERHRAILRQAMERYTDAPVLGALPKISPDPIPERHMGLISDREYAGREEMLERLARIMRENLDMPRILEAARSAPPAPDGIAPLWPEPARPARVSIGYVRDAALWFYYPENLEALERAGARLHEISLLSPAPWPALDGLYLGGGFPETQAQALHANPGLARLRELHAAGLPIYAECGGFMVLCQGLDTADAAHPMAGILPVRAALRQRPQGLGYVEAEVVGDNPFHPTGARFKGHEFHYSHCVAPEGTALPLALRLSRGAGMTEGGDGIVLGNTFASYTHLHALAAPWWAERFVAAAAAYRGRQAKS